MPLIYQQSINTTTRLGLWHIEETEDFFLDKVNLQREIHHPRKRLQHLAGRYLLKELFPDFPYELLMIADTRKPFLANEAYHFSISHCNNYAAVIISRNHRVGADVESFTDKIDKVKHKFLSGIEQGIIAAAIPPGADALNLAGLTAAWSIKESLFKWYGNGEVDFIEHLHIERIVFNGDSGIAYCKFLKGETTFLQVHFSFFDQNCISWVLSSISRRSHGRVLV